MKILLIRPPYVIPKTSVYGNKGVPSLGLAYLSAALKSENHDVECMDAYAEDMDCFTAVDSAELLSNGLTTEKIVERIPHDVQMIGISCMFSNEWINTSRVIKAIHAKFPTVFLVLGGEHVTADYEYILKNYNEVNCCILGEGEEKIKNLARQLHAGVKDLSLIEGITFLDKSTDSIITTEFPYRIKNINEIKTPDWESLSIRKFLDKGYGFSMQGRRTIPMLLSRGCPYRCTFCSNEKMWTTKWVSRDIDHVVDEIKKYIHLYRIEHIDFYDLTAVVNRNWTLAFCKRMIEENLQVTWALPSGTRSETLDFEVLSRLHQSGCTKITYAPETGSKILSKKIKKNVNPVSYT
ncbi:MAG: cobalamin-dependent protein, partial [Pseudobdellovibrio sp.]